MSANKFYYDNHSIKLDKYHFMVLIFKNLHNLDMDDLFTITENIQMLEWRYLKYM